MRVAWDGAEQRPSDASADRPLVTMGGSGQAAVSAKAAGRYAVPGHATRSATRVQAAWRGCLARRALVRRQAVVAALRKELHRRKVSAPSRPHLNLIVVVRSSSNMDT